MLKIGDFSKLSRISIRMLRQYGDSDALRRYLQIKHAEIKQEVQEAAERLRLLETTINRLGKDAFVMKYDITVKEMPKRNVASLREIIPSYDAEGMLWGKMMGELTPQKVAYANPCYAVAVFHDAEYKENDVDVEIQISVSGQYQDTRSVRFKTAEPILMASVTFQGGYDQLSEINEAIGGWISQSDYEFDGAMFNIYHVSPAMEKNPDKWVTEVCYPVKRK